MNFWNELWVAIEPAVITLVTALVGYAVTKACSWLGAKANEAKQTIKNDVASAVVQWVEQKYIELSSADKFEKAAEKISTILAQKKISVSNEEIEVLIESAVNAFNAEYFTHKEKDDVSVSAN